MLAFEDLQPGTRRRYGAMRVTEADILAYAREFDPQRFHLDTTSPGGVIASGWHTCAMNMRMTYDGFLADSTSAGAPGVDLVEWLRPVRPGMVLSVDLDILGVRVSRSRPEMGLVSLVFTIVDQTNEPVMRQRNWTIFYRRDPAAPFPANELPAPAPRVDPPEPPTHDDPDINRTRYSPIYEDAVIGARVDLGAYTFERERMLAFAHQFDPQPFHVDDAAAAASHFGKLAASGWQTAGAYMKCFVATRDRIRDEARARGGDSSSGRPSPGFNNLRWARPVFVGDTVRYETTLMGKQPSWRAGWGKLITRARGYNQNGQLVFESHGVNLAKMRG